MTQVMLAKSVGVSTTSIWQWKHGGAIPRSDLFEKLAHTLGVSIESLLTGSLNNPPEVNFSLSTLTASVSELGLEDLILEIKTRGFRVTIESK
jgi:transcriptional regulator with XRE-family HTH domain